MERNGGEGGSKAKTKPAKSLAKKAEERRAKISAEAEKEAERAKAEAERRRDDGGGGETVSESLAADIFAKYQCRSITDRGVEHPGDIAEASSLAAVQLPANDYPLWHALPPAVVEDGKLSRLQLEGVFYAAKAHQSILPSGCRQGFFLGDGAGVGKGRQIAGLVLDNFARNRRRAVWVSIASDLVIDARRDLTDLGIHVKVIEGPQELEAVSRKIGLPSDYATGVLFTTYKTLASPGKTKSTGKTRMDQIVEWACGGQPADHFEGLVAFDECHKAKNSMEGDAKAGKKAKSTQVAMACIALQQRLPRARVLYCSATGVTEVGNLGYMARMGWWGAGTSFGHFGSFYNTMKTRGVGFLELLALEMKAQGLYVSRGLSFQSCEFREAVAPMTALDVQRYDAACATWRLLRERLRVALEITKTGGADIWRRYWGSLQHFFKGFIISLKVPEVVRIVTEALAEGKAVVIGLQATGEAAARAEIAEAKAAGVATPGAAAHVTDFVHPTRLSLLSVIRTCFPSTSESVAAAAEIEDGAAGAAWPEASDDEAEMLDALLADVGEPKAMTPAVAAAVDRMRLEVEAAAESTWTPPNFLDAVIDALGGPERVAEMTGRKSRTVRRGGRLVVEAREPPVASGGGKDANVMERDAFMSGRKLIAIISDAASTGISLHADARAGNTRRRCHVTVELPWAADKAIQQLGRSHRSNQVTAPEYVLLSSLLGGERRFAAAVARRLESLGALTRGDRRAASGLDFSGSNLDTAHGRTALAALYESAADGGASLPAGVVLGDVTRQMAVAAPDTALDLSRMATVPAALHCVVRRFVATMDIEAGVDGTLESLEGPLPTEPLGPSPSGSNKAARDVKRFLNRVLGMPCGEQNLLYAALTAGAAAVVRAAKAAGKFSEGVSDLRGKVEPMGLPGRGLWETIWANEAAGQTLTRADLIVDRGVSFEEATAALDAEGGGSDADGFYVGSSPQFGRLAVLLAVSRPGRRADFAITRPNTGPSSFDLTADDLDAKGYAQVSPERAEPLWEQLYAASLESCIHKNCGDSSCVFGKRRATVTLLGGTLVPAWGTLEHVLATHEHRLPKGDATLKVTRTQLPSGQRVIGVRFPAHLIPEALELLRGVQRVGASGDAESLALLAAVDPRLASNVRALLRRQEAAAADASPEASRDGYGHTGGTEGAAAAAHRGGGTQTEPAAAVDAAALRRATAAPKTMLTFFQRVPGPGAAGSPGGGGGTPAAHASALAAEGAARPAVGGSSPPTKKARGAPPVARAKAKSKKVVAGKPTAAFGRAKPTGAAKTGQGGGGGGDGFVADADGTIDLT